MAKKQDKNGLESLEAEFEQWKSLVDQRVKEFTLLKDEEKDLTDRLVSLMDDLSGQEKLFVQLGKLKPKITILSDVIVQTKNRRDVARLAVAQYHEAAAASKASETWEAAKKARLGLNEILEERRRFHNGRDSRAPKSSEQERDAKRLQLDIDFAKAQASSLVADREAKRAGFALQKIRDEIGDLKIELGIE